MVGIDNFFWLVSTAAQAVAAVLGFAIAAYIFAYSQLDAKKQESDRDAIALVIASAQKKSRTALLVALVLGMASISVDLLFILLFSGGTCGDAMACVSLFLSLAALIATAVLVLRTIDPNSLSNAARAKAQEEGLVTPSSHIKASEFLSTCNLIERSVFRKAAQLYVTDDAFRMAMDNSGRDAGNLVSMRPADVISAMFVSNAISLKLHDQLISTLNKRDLIAQAHWNLEDDLGISAEAMEQAQQSLENLDKLE